MHVFDSLKPTIAQVPVDPAAFRDPVALTTEWTPLEKGGSNIKTHRLKQASDTQIEYTATELAVILPFLVMGFGFLFSGALAVCILMGNRAGWMLASNLWLLVPLLILLVAVGAGIHILYYLKRAPVFDKKLGRFWKGYGSPPRKPRNTKSKACVDLLDIHAVQLLAERCLRGSGGPSYTSYELNIVTRNGECHNIVDHAWEGQIRRDAEAISASLSVPVWDATGSDTSPEILKYS